MPTAGAFCGAIVFLSSVPNSFSVIFLLSVSEVEIKKSFQLFSLCFSAFCTELFFGYFSLSVSEVEIKNPFSCFRFAFQLMFENFLYNSRIYTVHIGEFLCFLEALEVCVML